MVVVLLLLLRLFYLRLYLYIWMLVLRAFVRLCVHAGLRLLYWEREAEGVGEIVQLGVVDQLSPR